MNQDTDNESNDESVSECEVRTETKNQTIGKLVKRSNFLGQMVSISIFNNRAFESLPFTNYNEFAEKFTKTNLNININLFTENKCIFIPDVPIKVEVQAHRKTGHHFFNQFNYAIKLTHGNYIWKVKREYKELREVHKILSKIAKKDLGKSCSEIEQDEIRPDWPMFPCERDYHIQENQISERCKQIEEYLERCLMYPRYRDHPSMLKFLCISPISFLNGVSPSLIEDFLYKHSFQNFYYGHLRHLKKFFCSNFHILNQKRWFAVKDTYIAYLNSYLNSSLGFVILVDINFKFQAKIKPGAYFAIQLKNSQRSIILKFKRSENQKKWLQSIQKMVETTGQYFKNLDLLPHSSFAPVRQSQICKWYVNSNEYMEDLFKALDNAKEEIFIAGWWLCPEIYLKRPTYNKNHRLDSILIKKSKQNVKIYILLYKEIDLLLCLSSERVKKVLTQNYTNPNIKIILHPKNNAPNFSMWSHHEKIVVIDQSIAFFGGIDLCFGRWDDEEHRLVDVNDNIDNIDAKRYPFMSETMEHDIKGDKVMNLNEALSKIVRNSAITCKLAANVNNDSILKLEETIFTFNKINPKLEEMEKSRSDKIKKKFSRFKKILELKGGFNKIEALSNNFSDHDDELVKDPTVEIRFWMGKDYTNCYIEDFKNIHDFSTDQFDRNEVPRTPWRDQGAVTLGESARDLARHFIQRWNQAKIEMAEKNMDYPFLLPKGYHRPIEVETDFLGKKFSKCSIQILRSLDLWSGGLLNTESSILNAYCHLIENSDHYIYIENQFFVTTCNTEKDTMVKNCIGSFLVKRIARAFRENKKFRVYIVIPLLPGFDNFNTILAVQYFNLRSIKFGNFSIFNELENQGINPFNYITFHGMRNWSVLMGKLVQENVYVHSKLMIVDDRHVICGSANINDRSMLGKRDSEIAALIHDEEFIDSKLDNKNVKVGKYAYNLRSKIFKLHLGIYFYNPELIDVSDCVCDEFFFNFKLVSNKNTQIYDQVFKCLPSDNVETLQTLKTYSYQPCLNKSDPIQAKLNLENVMGFIVDFPLNFLSKEGNFFPNITTPEGLVPTSTWT